MQRQEFTIRAGTRKDAEESARLWMQSAREHASYDHIYNTSPRAERVMRRHLAELSSTSNAFFFVAAHKERIVGFLSGELREGSPAFDPRSWASIDDVFVLPEYRSHGAGTALIEHCKRWAKDRSANGISLQVAAGNTRARSLYTRLGFREVSVYEVLEL